MHFRGRSSTLGYKHILTAQLNSCPKEGHSKDLEKQSSNPLKESEQNQCTASHPVSSVTVRVGFLKLHSLKAAWDGLAKAGFGTVALVSLQERKAIALSNYLF